MREIAIIGAGGKMGAWFVGYFSRRVQSVVAYDVDRKSIIPPSGNVRIAQSVRECVKGADLALVCVPVRLTPQVIGECAKAMKPGAAVAEISSVKHRTFPALLKVRADLLSLCIHPMFGPGASEKKQARILLVPVRNEGAELRAVNELFPSASVKVLQDARTHDRSIAVILGLTYFANLAFAKIMSQENLALLKEISGTTFGLQSLLAESILTDEPDLISALIRENPAARKYIQKYLKEASAVAKLASAKSGRGLDASVRKTKSRLQKKQDLQQSYRRMYEMIEGLK